MICNLKFLYPNIQYQILIFPQRTLKEASEILGIHQMTIKGRLNSNNFENYEYIS